MVRHILSFPYRHRSFFLFNDTATTEIYTLSLHDALPISLNPMIPDNAWILRITAAAGTELADPYSYSTVKLRSEEHTSELQSRLHLVCRLLLEKKKKTKNQKTKQKKQKKDIDC